MDHYDVLQVNRKAEPEVIEKAYKALCLKYHPDRAPVEEQRRATRRMQRINEAYHVLSDPRSRALYDTSLPPEAAQTGWEQFLEEGLVGLFKDWAKRRR